MTLLCRGLDCAAEMMVFTEKSFFYAHCIQVVYKNTTLRLAALWHLIFGAISKFLHHLIMQRQMTHITVTIPVHRLRVHIVRKRHRVNFHSTFPSLTLT